MATVTIPKVLANFETSLATRMSASATSLTLSRSTDNDSTTLSGLYSLTINEGESTEEHMFVTLTGASGAVSKRGISRVDLDTEVAGNKYEHDRGASVKITNVTTVMLHRLLNGDDSFNSVDWDGVNSIDGLATPTTGQQAAHKNYVDLVASAAGGISAFLATDAGGLDIDVGSGYFATDDGVVTYAGVSGETMTDNATNYVMLDTSGKLIVNTTGWVASNVPIAIVTTVSGDITVLTDARAWLTSPSADRFVTDDYTFGATITAGELVYLDTSDAKWKLADGSTKTTATGVIGVALDSGVDTDTGKRVQTSGQVTGLTGLTAGYQYVSGTPGSLTDTPATYKKMVGYAPDATTLILIPTFSPLELEGVESSATTETFNLSMDYTASIFGTGGDGAGTISSNTDLTRDMYYTDLTIQNGFTLKPKGHRIFVNGTLTCEGTGTISASGDAGNNGDNAPSSSVGGDGGDGGSAAYSYGTLPLPVDGGGGKGGVSDGGAASTNGSGTILSITKPLNNASGVQGGTSSGSGTPPDASGVKTGTGEQVLQVWRAMTLGHIVAGTWDNGYSSVGNSGGGGGAKSTAAVGSGGGGGGAGGSGGICLVAAKTIGTLNIEAAGGDGGSGGDPNGGNASGGSGGAGGNGGVIIIITAESTTINSDVTGGTGGTAGSGGGSAGSSGNSGQVFTISI